MQSINTLMSTVIMVSFIVTIVLALGSYLAYKVRERRRPRTARRPEDDAPVYFERFYPAHADAAPTSASSSGATPGDAVDAPAA